MFETFHGDSDSVNMETVKERKRKLPEIIREYWLKDIFNTGEIGLFNNLYDKQRLLIKGENCNGRKLSKIRLTVLLRTGWSKKHDRK